MLKHFVFTKRLDTGKKSVGRSATEEITATTTTHYYLPFPTKVFFFFKKGKNIYLKLFFFASGQYLFNFFFLRLAPVFICFVFFLLEN